MAAPRALSEIPKAAANSLLAIALRCSSSMPTRTEATSTQADSTLLDQTA